MSNAQLRRVLSSLGPKVGALMQDTVKALSAAAYEQQDLATRAHLFKLTRRYEKLCEWEAEISYEAASVILKRGA